MMRLATLSDRPQLLEGARDFVSRISFRHLIDDNNINQAIDRILTLPGLEVLVVEHNNEIVAGIGLLISPYLWNPKLIVADELFWWTSTKAPFGTAHGLVSSVITNLRSNNITPMFHVLDTSPAGVDRMYRKLGLRPVDTVYM